MNKFIWRILRFVFSRVYLCVHEVCLAQLSGSENFVSVREVFACMKWMTGGVLGIR